jgi:hypothetical protein
MHVFRLKPGMAGIMIEDQLLTKAVLKIKHKQFTFSISSSSVKPLPVGM